MSFFSTQSPDRYGILIDIGSGSVLVAIVHSTPTRPHPTIVWHQREQAPLKNIDAVEQSSKAVMTALVNATILLDSDGRKALRDYAPRARLTELQCSVCAPWSYTVTKSVHYDHDSPFTITEDLLEELQRTAEQKVAVELKENEALQKFGLTVVANGLIDIQANGYQVTDPVAKTASALSITHVSAITQQYLVDSLTEIREKLFPSTTITTLSFALMLYLVSKDFLSGATDICLIDVTYEATEIGIVRDSSLMYCTHMPFGSYSLAREIAAVTGVPLSEAFGYLHHPEPLHFVSDLSDSKKADVEAIMDAYVDRLVKLFQETGDDLSIPRRIAVHAAASSEPLFKLLLERAAKRAIKTEARVIMLSQQIISRFYPKREAKNKHLAVPSDTAMLLSAQFFHTRPAGVRFEYL